MKFKNFMNKIDTNIDILYDFFKPENKNHGGDLSVKIKYDAWPAIIFGGEKITATIILFPKEDGVYQMGLEKYIQILKAIESCYVDSNINSLE